MTTHMLALYAREVKRFQKIWMDTLFSPIVTVGLYLAVFGVVAGGQSIGDVNYLSFLYSGLIGMMIINASFSNPSFALVIAKNLGNIIDLQITPLRPWEVGLAYSLAAVTRGLVTIGIAVLATVWFIPLDGIAHPLSAVGGILLSGLEFGLLGVIFGIWAKGFEALTFMTQFIMQPMIFLGGVFYPVANLPGFWPTISLFNPLHHNINLIRYGITGYSDVNPLISLTVAAVLTIVLFVTMHVVTKKKLRDA